jgi:hypothetical protein
MIERVVIETDASLQEVQDALARNGATVTTEGENMTESWHKPRDFPYQVKLIEAMLPTDEELRQEDYERES